jgi:hypothetical protein
LIVFENRVLRGIFEPMRKEVTGDWGRLHNEELHNLYVSSNIIGVMKSRRKRWVEHVIHMGEVRHIYNFGWKTLRGDTSEDLGVDGSKIWEWTLGKRGGGGRCGLDPSD